MKNNFFFSALLLIVISAVAVVGCKKDNDSDNNNNNNNNNNNCQMTAKVDGADFCGNGYYVFDANTKVMTIQATNVNTLETIQFNLNNAGVGTFQFGFGTDGAGYTKNPDTYLSISGTLNITKFENNTVEGNFSFVGEIIGGGATKNVTDGTFSIPKL